MTSATDHVAITAASAVALTRLRAAGGPVPVHSRYPSGVNLDVNGTLVYAGPRAGGGACSIEVSARDVEVLHASSSWTWLSGGLVSADGTSSVALSDTVSVYEPLAPSLARLDPAAERRLRLARSSAGHASWFDDGLGRDVALPRLRTAITALVSPAEDAAPLVRGVVGLGSGLTPSCDDALVGALCLLTACGHRPAFSAESLLRDSPTTDVSASSLRLALAGMFSTQLVQVVAQLEDGAVAGHLEPAVRELVAVGATSGADSLVGVELACEALTSRP